MYFVPKVGWAGTTSYDGTLVRIRDQNFDENPARNEVFFHQNQKASVVSLTPKEAQYLLKLAFGGIGSCPGEFYFPTDLATDSTDQTYVVNKVTGENGRVDIFSKDGIYVKSVGKNDLWIPYGIALDSQGDIYVSEETKSGQGRIAVFSSNGGFKFQRGVGTLSTDPRGLAVDDQGNIYVADAGKSMVFKLDADGIGVTSLSPSGDPFQSPRDVAFDSTSGKVYITDPSANAIQIFQNDIYSEKWHYGRKSVRSKELGATDPWGDGLAVEPFSIAIDAAGNLLVIFDVGIFKLNNIGSLISAAIPSEISPSGKLDNPISVALNSAGELVVLDNTNLPCVKVYQPIDYQELLVHVPLGAETGPISVIKPTGTLTSDDNFEVLRIAEPSEDANIPAVLKVELTQGVASYPFVTEKETLLWAHIKGYFGHPTQDAAMVQIIKPDGSKYKQLVKTFTQDISKGVTIAKFHIPNDVTRRGKYGEYEIKVRFTRDGQLILGQSDWSIKKTFYDVKPLSLLFVKFTNIPDTQWGQQNPFSWFLPVPFFEGVATIRRTFPINNLAYHFHPGVYLPELVGGVQDKSEMNQLTDRALDILKDFRDNKPDVHIDRVVGLISPNIPVPVNGWAWHHACITPLAYVYPKYFWGGLLAHEVGHTYHLVPADQDNHDPQDPGNHSKNQTLVNEEGAPITVWSSIEDIFLEAKDAYSIMAQNVSPQDYNCFFESRSTQGNNLDYHYLFNNEFKKAKGGGLKGGCFVGVMDEDGELVTPSEKNVDEKIVMGGSIFKKEKAVITQSFLTKEEFTITADEDSLYNLVFFDKEGRILARNGFSIVPIQDGKDNGQDNEIFSVVKPFPKGAVRVEIRYESKLLADLNLSKHAPSVESVCVELREPLPPIVKWNAKDEDGDSLQYTVLYSSDNGRTFEPIGVGIRKMEYIWDHSTTPGSDHGIVKVVASDGLRKGFALSRSFQLPKKKPQIAILNPKNGTVIQEGQAIKLMGFGYDAEDGELDGQNLKWWLDGTILLGTGQSLRVDGLLQETNEGPTNRPINPGIHTISLTAVDSDQNHVGVQIHIKIVTKTQETSSRQNRRRTDSRKQ